MRTRLGTPGKETSTSATTTSVSPQPRVAHVVTSDRAALLMQGQVQYLQRLGFDVTLICSPGERLDVLGRMEGVQIIELSIAREIAPLRDIVSLWRLWRILHRLSPDLTNVGTPKAGLLGGFAAWLTRIPCRFYTLRGLRFETANGLKRWLLIYAERLACCFAHRVICVSPSLREKAVVSGFTSRERTVVFGTGSSNGVDASRFAPTPERIRKGAELRHELGIPPLAPVVGFIGRLTCDKGIPELVEAFLQLREQFPDLRLLLLGCFEEEDPLPIQTRRCIEMHRSVIFPGYIEDTAPYYALVDVLVLPSHREGFPNVVLEAHAAGKPVVAARATGAIDAVVDGETGLLFPVGDVTALADALAKLLTDKTLASKMGLAGQERIKREFRQERIWDALCAEYVRRLKMEGRPLPVMPALEEVRSGGRSNE